ncbi:hypothetical protein DRQ25_12170 [Candidatus Fermentibacteria bacterium]|nr:MAG: hypothetical protein DRQ25_12170 [Candidatus Fermentibacteria bacterium]
MGSRSKQWAHSRIFSNDDAVSTVVSFILLFGLIMSVILFARMQYVPLWSADVEARHADDVFASFSEIPGNIDNLVLGSGSVAVSRQRIRLGSGSIPIIAPGTSYGALGVVPDEGNFTVEADVWAVNITRNNTGPHSLENGSVNITNISSISSFYIHIDKIEYNTVSPGDVCIRVTNQGHQNGLAEIKTESNAHLNISIWNGYGDKVIEDLPITDDNSVVERYNIDLLSPCYGFDMVLYEVEAEVLADADAPYYNLTITNSTSLNGSRIRYEVVYNEYNRTLVHYKKTSNGTMMYESRNRHFLNQKFIYQNGAVFLCQQPAATVRTAPEVLIRDYRNYTRILIPLISVGTGRHRIPLITGSGVEELQIELKHADCITFADGNNTESVSIIITPPAGDEEFRENYLQEWADYFTATVAGTSVEANPEWSPDGSYTYITITLTGSIHLEIKDIDVEGRIASISQLE